MPTPVVTDDIEIIIENTGGGGGGGIRPPLRGDGDGDDSGKKRPSGGSSLNRYKTGISLGILSILMFFMALVSAFLVRKGTSNDWIPVHLPLLIWINTAVLLASSATLEIARQRLAQSDNAGFRKIWTVTTALGILFLLGQIFVWKQLAAQGIFIASNPASSFFYVFTGAHGLHLLGGVGALIFVAMRKAEARGVSLSMAAEVTGYYWHFMDGLWVFLLMILFLGK
ncbi:MAG TPA: cytochrome c oxidase subunit 3 [Candidatus Dormibacteraeota bacterium]|nr:cytochrome c oxidase subunit 3 [Candidatus Dormibacteraeota bacterium]